uniref:Uncharacterized protein n=1 Tax=Arundo donax TaxID=35708 RepID=A0A0A8YWA1_ARUDO
MTFHNNIAIFVFLGKNIIIFVIKDFIVR